MERRSTNWSQGTPEAQAYLGDTTAAEGQWSGPYLAMFSCAPDAKLGGFDLDKLRIADVALGGTIRQRSTVVKQETGRPVPFELTDPTRDAFSVWLLERGGRSDDWLFPSRSAPGRHIGTRQYARLVEKSVRLIDR